MFLKAQARALFYIFDGIFWHPRSAAKMLRFSIHCIFISRISLLRTAAFDLRCTIIYFDYWLWLNMNIIISCPQQRHMYLLHQTMKAERRERAIENKIYN